MRKITRKQIIENIYGRLNNINKEVIKKVVNCFIEEIKGNLVKDDDIVIELRNFGVFEKKKYAKNYVINPKTRAKIKVKKVFKIKFKPSKIIKESLKVY